MRDRFEARSDKLKALGRKVVHKDIDPFVALRNVFSAEHAYIVNGYLVVYDIEQMWWSDEPVLAERLIFALEPTSDISAVVEFLCAKGKEIGAKLVGFGTALATSDAALARVYKSNGCHQISVQLVKEID